jgi:hypothetical protein
VDVQECIHTLQGKGGVDNALVTGHCWPNQQVLSDGSQSASSLP